MAPVGKVTARRYGNRVPVVRLTTVGSEMEAAVVCGLLRSEGIHCFQQHTNRSAAISLSLGGGPRAVFVDQDDYDRAREILESAPEPERFDAEP